MFAEEWLPVPSAIAPMIAAIVIIDTSNPFYALLQVFLVVSVLGSLFSVLSSYFTYGLGFYGGKNAIERFGRFLGVKWDHVKSFEQGLTTGNEHLYIAVLRSIPLMPLSLISASAGFFRVDWKTYGLYSFIGMMPRNLILGMTGWYLKDSYTQAADIISQLTIAFVILLISGLTAYVKIFRPELVENIGDKGLKGYLVRLYE
jgi:uncharacterized membrane protein YdjX (TVP38/TMEM64 family)